MRLPLSSQYGLLRSPNLDSKVDVAEFRWRDIPGTVWRFLDSDKRGFVIFNLVLFAVYFYELVPAYLVGKIVDFFTNYKFGSSLSPFYLYIIILGVSYGLVAIIRLYSKNELSRIGIATRSRVKVMGFERLMNFSILWHAQENTGNKVQRILTGSQSLMECTKIVSNNLYLVIVNFTAVSIFFLLVDWRFFLFLLIYSAVFFVIQFGFNRKIERLSLAYNQAFEKSSGSYIEGTGNILSIKAIGAEQKMHSQIKTQEEVAQGLQYQVIYTNNLKWRFFQIWNACAYPALLLIIGSQFLAGAISLGMILVLYTYFNKLRESANDTNDLTATLIGFKADMARMMPIFKESASIRSGQAKFPDNWSEIVLKNAEFKYPGERVGLTKFNLTIPRGARFGVAGASGSGKSTLARVMLGLYEIKSGEFRIDNLDFYDMSREELMRQFAIVLQETELFNLTLRENITVMRDLDPRLLELAIQVADLKEVIARLPEGLDTMIGERGYSLSGGERQRIGIARAIYKNCPILVLDEATSALDSKTEKRIIDKLFSGLGADKTFVIIAHRLSTLLNADQVIVIERGQIVERGGFRELLRQKDSRLGKLYALQNNSSHK